MNTSSKDYVKDYDIQCFELAPDQERQGRHNIGAPESLVNAGIPGGEHRWEEGKARIGPGAMASKEQQVIRDLAVENDEKENEGGKASKQSEEESLPPLGRG
ncbi:hypothetical protein A6R68_12279, partial [Neotoma lepida]